MAEIALVGQAWPERALLAAELTERGHDVTGFTTLDDALVPLRLGLLVPALLILDTLGLALSDQSLASLQQDAPDTAVLVIAAPSDVAQFDRRGKGFADVLVRPVFIGQVADRAEQILSPQ